MLHEVVSIAEPYAARKKRYGRKCMGETRRVGIQKGKKRGATQGCGRRADLGKKKSAKTDRAK